MTEHVHEWRFGYRSDGNYNLPGASTPGFYCTHKECGYDSGSWLSLAEAEARINEYETLKAATERLNAEDARRARYGYQYQDVDKALTAYANILEGKDE